MKNKENICNEIDIKPFAYAISLIDGKCIFYFGFGKKKHLDIVN